MAVDLSPIIKVVAEALAKGGPWLTLAGLIAALVTFYLVQRDRAKVQAAQSAQPEDRAGIFGDDLEKLGLKIRTSQLQEGPSFKIAMEALQQRERQRQRWFKFSVFLTVVLALFAWAFRKPGPPPYEEPTLEVVGPPVVTATRSERKAPDGSTVYELVCQPQLTLIASGNGPLEIESVRVSWTTGGSREGRDFQGVPDKIVAPGRASGWVNDGGGLGTPNWKFTATRTYTYRAPGSRIRKTATYTYTCAP